MKARKLGQNLASVGGGAGHGEVSKNGGELERERERERERDCDGGGVWRNRQRGPATVYIMLI